MTKIRENGAASGIGVLASFAYDDLGRRTSFTRGNGTVTSYTFDAISRLGQLIQDIGGTTRDLTLGFAYNPASQIASTTRSNDDFAWTGHDSGTMTATTNGVAQSANGLNQIGSWAGSIGYDSKGNVITHGSSSYGFSSENLLLTYANPSDASQTSATYSYDPLMRLAAIDSNSAAFDVQLGHDGNDIALEDSGGGKRRRYIHGPGIDEPLMSSLVNGASTFRDYYHADERGSIVSISDLNGAAGTVGKYDEYGAGIGISHFQYAGQYWLVAGEIYYSRARNYNPKLGRFLQPDPIGYGDGMNMYGYVGGDPVNFTDPTGLCAANEHKVFDTGSRIGRCAANGSGDEGGLANGYSGFSSAGVGGRSGGHYEYVKGHGPASTASNGDIVISGDRVWVPDVAIGSFSILQGNPNFILAAGEQGFDDEDDDEATDKTDIACGIFSDGIGCKHVSYKELCTGATNRRKALTGFVAADAAIVGKEGLIKQLGKDILARLVAAEIAADVIDELMYCE